MSDISLLDPYNNLVKASNNFYKIKVNFHDQNSDDEDPSPKTFSYSLYIVNDENKSINNSNLPPFYHTISSDIDIRSYIFYDYYRDHSLYIFTDTELEINSLISVNFYTFFTDYVNKDFFKNAYNSFESLNDSSEFFNNDSIIFDRSSSVFGLNKDLFLDISYVSEVDLEDDISQDQTPKHLLSDLLNSLIDGSFKAKSNFDLNTDYKFSIQDSDSKIMKRIPVTSVPSQNSPICSHYTFISDTVSVVSENYNFANQIKFFPICSSPSREGQINFCLHAYNRQYSCEVYSSSLINVASYNNDKSNYVMKYYKTLDSHFFDIYLGEESLVMRYSYPFTDKTFEESLSISLHLFDNFIVNFNQNFDKLDHINANTESNCELNSSNNFFYHLANS
jgi:hypothetical protein